MPRARMFLLTYSDRHSLQKEQAYGVNTLIFVNTGRLWATLV
jgi:hypothetical protein